MTFDESDIRILRVIQSDASLSFDEIGTRVGLSRNAVWRRIRLLDEAGVIQGRVAVLDPAKLGLALTVFIFVRTGSHDPDWLERFAKATRDAEEIQGAYRMTGDLDYLIRARVADVAAYDALYQRLIRQVDMTDVSASFVMEDLKETTALPL